ncbi:MAG: hypothetical protein U0Y68_06780 [Blastocatellia bacterium]
MLADKGKDSSQRFGRIQTTWQNAKQNCLSKENRVRNCKNSLQIRPVDTILQNAMRKQHFGKMQN